MFPDWHVPSYLTRSQFGPPFTTLVTHTYLTPSDDDLPQSMLCCKSTNSEAIFGRLLPGLSLCPRKAALARTVISWLARMFEGFINWASSTAFK